MAGAVKNFDSVAADDDVEIQFQRTEMYQSNIAGTVDPYDRHVFLCSKTCESWAPRIEDFESDTLPKLLSASLNARKDDIKVKTCLTICEGREGTDFSDGDVMIFPEMIKYRSLKVSDVGSFVEDVFVNGNPWPPGVQEVLLTGSHVFVCAHSSRDRKCGVCGPVLVEKFKDEIELRGLQDQVFVSACSHIGEHKYPGNLIIFSADREGKITGHWYGYVTPNDVAVLLVQHIGKGQIIERLWRGKMGPNEKEMGQSEMPKGGSSQDKKKDVTSRSLGAYWFSYSRDGNLEVKKTMEVPGKKKLMGKWEGSDVLVAAALVGGVATIAVVYSFFRRSGCCNHACN